ncbi:MAG: 3-hydroxyanthranilate 3,4-dioxygenase [Bacteroidota bacterium]|nr:3-hydroxyanthranilate 3,4-dioxygenase [Bacteroidota bacterium]
MEAFNLLDVIEKVRHELMPPVCNRNLTPESKDYITMLVAGPNARKDFHYNETEELFYQLEGDITVVTIQDGRRKEIQVKEGELFILPASIPHSPVRPEGSLGIVIEKVRKKSEKDGLMWFCESCDHKLYEAYFKLESIEKDFLPVFKTFYESEELRTCDACGNMLPTDSRDLA